jgi:hypothetical protein
VRALEHVQFPLAELRRPLLALADRVAWLAARPPAPRPARTASGAAVERLITAVLDPPPPPLPSRTNWTRLVPRPVLNGHVSPPPVPSTQVLDLEGGGAPQLHFRRNVEVRARPAAATAGVFPLLLAAADSGPPPAR